MVYQLKNDSLTNWKGYKMSKVNYRYIFNQVGIKGETGHSLWKEILNVIIFGILFFSVVIGLDILLKDFSSYLVSLAKFNELLGSNAGVIYKGLSLVVLSVGLMFIFLVLLSPIVEPRTIGTTNVSLQPKIKKLYSSMWIAMFIVLTSVVIQMIIWN